MGIYTPLQKCDRWGNLNQLFSLRPAFFGPRPAFSAKFLDKNLAPTGR
jgi:hypothetical protein